MYCMKIRTVSFLRDKVIELEDNQCQCNEDEDLDDDIDEDEDE